MIFAKIQILMDCLASATEKMQKSRHFLIIYCYFCPSNGFFLRDKAEP